MEVLYCEDGQTLSQPREVVASPSLWMFRVRGQCLSNVISLHIWLCFEQEVHAGGLKRSFRTSVILQLQNQYNQLQKQSFFCMLQLIYDVARNLICSWYRIQNLPVLLHEAETSSENTGILSLQHSNSVNHSNN